MELPEEDKNPYGEYTHTSPDGRYRFEWTPFTPAIVAWRNAEGHLRRAAANLARARTLKGFAINGMGTDHNNFIKSLDIFIEDTESSIVEADRVRRILEVANLDYARSNDASYEEYARIMGALQGEQARRAAARGAEDTQEAAEEAKRDKEVAPFEFGPPPADQPTPAPGPGQNGPPQQQPPHEPTDNPGPAVTPPS